MKNNTDVTAIRSALKAIKSVPSDQAHNMIPAFFTSPEFLELEKIHIFRKEWICLGHESEIARPNDYFTTELVDEQLLVTRDMENKVRVLSNVCRHRANLIATGSGNRRNFTCSYHGWTYSNGGNLIAAPLMDKVENFNKKNCKLPEFACEVWQGFIFVNLDNNAEPLANRLEGLLPYIKNHHMKERSLVFSEEVTWQTNWKCLVENFMEGYHLDVTHRDTLAPLNPTGLCKKLPGGEGFTGYRAGYNPAYKLMEPIHPDLSKEEGTASWMFCIYPSFVMSVDPNTTSWMIMRSDQPDEVKVKWGVVALDPGNAGAEVSMQENIDFMHSFNAEDKEKLEALQKGLKTRHMEKNYLAPADYEGTVWDFYQFMASRLGQDVVLDEV